MKYRLFDGFKFGIMLQIAVGPVCFFIFQISISHGLIPALLGTLGVTLVDGLYILMAILGIGKLIERNKRIENILKYFGSLVLVLFGLYILIASTHNSSFLQSNVAKIVNFNPFISAILLTVSNPLTIIFWTGVFASKTANENMNFNELFLFGIGSIISTLAFLSLVSVMGYFTKIFINEYIIILFNVLVGTLLIFFGFKPYIKIRTITT